MTFCAAKVISPQNLFQDDFLSRFSDLIAAGCFWTYLDLILTRTRAHGLFPGFCTWAGRVWNGAEFWLWRGFGLFFRTIPLNSSPKVNELNSFIHPKLTIIKRNTNSIFMARTIARHGSKQTKKYKQKKEFTKFSLFWKIDLEFL